MLEIFKSNPAVSMLKEDHDRVQRLFDQFEKAKDKPAKRKIVREALTELKVHAAIEEELFYPAVRKTIGQEIMNEADEEHHVAKVLVAELEKMTGDEDHWDAKFKVLAESVRHHIKEEEGEMMPKIKGKGSEMEDLGVRMAERKEELKENPDSLGKKPRGSASSGARKSSSRTGSSHRRAS